MIVHIKEHRVRICTQLFNFREEKVVKYGIRWPELLRQMGFCQHHHNGIRFNLLNRTDLTFNCKNVLAVLLSYNLRTDMSATLQGSPLGLKKTGQHLILVMRFLTQHK